MLSIREQEREGTVEYTLPSVQYSVREAALVKKVESTIRALDTREVEKLHYLLTPRGLYRVRCAHTLRFRTSITHRLHLSTVSNSTADGEHASDPLPCAAQQTL